MHDDVGDPWAAELPQRSASRGGHLVRPALATLIGAVVPVSTVLGDGQDGRRAGVVVALTSVGVVVGLVLARHRLAAGIAVVVASAAAGATLSVPMVGRAPVLVAVAATVVVHSSLEDRAPARAPRRWQDGTVLIAIPLVLVGELTWARTGGLVIAAVSILSGAAVVVAHRLGSRNVARASEALGRAGVAVGSGVGTVALAVVAIPTLYLPGAAASVARTVTGRRVRWDDPRSNWQRTAAADAGTWRRDASRPFRSAPIALRRRRNLTGVVLVAAVVLGVIWVRDRDPGTDVVATEPTGQAVEPGSGEEQVKADLAALDAVPYSERPAFAEVPDADDLQAEFRRLQLVPGPVGDYTVGDFAGRFFNVSGGVRRSATAECEGCRTARLWLVGGSAAFGTGQRDDGTVASELVRRAADDGIALEVSNIAAPGWTLWQEYQAVAARLADGGERPDAVVFLDGFNDVGGTIVTSMVRGLDPRVPTVMSSEDTVRFLQLDDELLAQIDGTELGRLAAERYESLRAEIATQLSASDIDSVFFFQPDALASDAQREPVRRLYEGTAQARVLPALGDALESASAALEPQVHDLRGIFDDAAAPVFADTVHTNEVGASVTAGAMYQVLSPMLTQRAR